MKLGELNGYEFHQPTSGGKAGKGCNKTSTIQVRLNNCVKKQVTYKVGDTASMMKAMQKAKDYVHAQRANEQGLQKQHASPCNECPFRKKSLPGYIGDHSDVSEIIDIVQGDGKFPCHMQVNVVRKQQGCSYKDALVRAPVCAGSAAFLCNQIKVSRDPEVGAAQKLVGTREDVFGMPGSTWSIAEMTAHHKRYKKG